MGKGQLSQVTKRKGQFKEPCVSPFRQGLQTPKEHHGPTKQTLLRVPTASDWLYCLILANHVIHNK